MKITANSTAALFLGCLAACGLGIAEPGDAWCRERMFTEDFLNTLGVNTHLQGLTPADPWNTNLKRDRRQLNFIGVRIVRDWVYRPEDGQLFKDLQNAWRPDGRFWTSIVEGSPADQRKSLALSQAAWQNFPGLIYAMGGPNEEDDDYPQKLGATLPDSALVQTSLYNWAHPLGIRVSQMEFGADGRRRTTGKAITTRPTPAATRTTRRARPISAPRTRYVSDPKQRHGDSLNMLRKNARLCTPGKPVAHTEVGAYTHAHLTPRVFGQFLVMGALDSAAAGDVGYLVYGLQDSRPEATYGFFSFPDGVAHPAAQLLPHDDHALEEQSRQLRPGRQADLHAGRPECIVHKQVDQPSGDAEADGRVRDRGLVGATDERDRARRLRHHRFRPEVRHGVGL